MRERVQQQQQKNPVTATKTEV